MLFNYQEKINNLVYKNQDKVEELIDVYQKNTEKEIKNKKLMNKSIKEREKKNNELNENIKKNIDFLEILQCK